MVVVMVGVMVKVSVMVGVGVRVSVRSIIRVRQVRCWVRVSLGSGLALG